VIGYGHGILNNQKSKLIKCSYEETHALATLYRLGPLQTHDADKR